MEMDTCTSLIMPTIEFKDFHLVRALSFLLDFFHLCLFLYVVSNSTTNAVTVAGLSFNAGAGFSDLNYPYAIALDLNSTMYILDTTNYRVVKWLYGQPLGFAVVGGRGLGSTLDKIGTSYALYLDDQSNIYVSENSNHRVTKWTAGNTAFGVLVI